MFVRFVRRLVAVVGATAWAALVSSAAVPVAGQAADGWRGSTDVSLAVHDEVATPATSGGDGTRGGVRVSKGTGSLPNDHGQVWRDYDIRPYTSQVKNNARPEQAIVDWILRETGTETWFTEPLGLLSADRNTLHVYHTPDMQRVVSDVVQRFIRREGRATVFSLRLVSLSSANWRTKSYAMLRPVAIQSPGAEAWLLSKEHAALLLSDLRKRTDFFEHNSPNLVMHDGEMHSLARTQPLTYVRSAALRPGSWSQYDLQMGQIEEGIWLEFSPLTSLDGQTVDAVVKCRTLQVEKLVPIWINVPSTLDPRQRTKIQVPQTSSWQLHERFRWPASDVLMISCGIVAAPGPVRSSVGLSTLTGGVTRAEVLLFVESRGRAENSLAGQANEQSAGATNYRGRY